MRKPLQEKKRSSQSLFLSHLSLLDHGDLAHPENRHRLQHIIESIENSPFKDCLDVSLNRLASKQELMEVHDQHYVEYLHSLIGKEAVLDPETKISCGSVNAALIGAGLGIELVEQVLEGKIQTGFSLVRPPGHHARPSIGMGFCLLNNIALAAKKALSLGLKRILILDWDVHHGNGTQEIFYSDDQILFIDLHQENLFPVNSGGINEIGEGKGFGYTVNIPLPARCRDEDYFYVFEKVVKPIALAYHPELILVSAGFDAHESDPLGFMNLTSHGYHLLTKKVKFLADKVCGGKVIFFLEGGYNPYFLAKNVMECIHALCSEEELSYSSLELKQFSQRGLNDIKTGEESEEIQPSLVKLITLIEEINAIHFK